METHQTLQWSKTALSFCVSLWLCSYTSYLASGIALQVLVVIYFSCHHMSQWKYSQEYCMVWVANTLDAWDVTKKLSAIEAIWLTLDEYPVIFRLFNSVFPTRLAEMSATASTTTTSSVLQTLLSQCQCQRGWSTHLEPLMLLLDFEEKQSTLLALSLPTTSLCSNLHIFLYLKWLIGDDISIKGSY